jgi:prepilin-type N-terminal cleavage/methylation domain-containing protein
MEKSDNYGSRIADRGLVNPRSEFRNPQSNGFTLVEIVLTIVLIGIVSGIAAVIIMQGARSASSVKSRVEAHEQARFAIDRMSRELLLIRSRAAVPVDDIIAMNATTLEYNDITGAHIGFRLNGNTLERYDGSWQTLSTGITAPGGTLFTYLDANGNPTAAQAALWNIQVGLVATQGPESLTLRTTVHPRNF